MTLLLALIAIAAYFSMPEEWRLRLSTPLPHWLGWSHRVPVGNSLRLAIAVIVPMIILAVALQLLDELASIFVFLLSAVIVIAVFGDSQANRIFQQIKPNGRAANGPVMMSY